MLTTFFARAGSTYFILYIAGFKTHMHIVHCRLFLMSSKLSNKLPSDTCTKTTVINFSATLEGYQDQLLSATIHIVGVLVI